MNTPYFSDTIAAIATGPAQGGVGIVRISGHNVLLLAQTLTQGKTPNARQALYANIYDEHARIIDDAILLFFPAPHSFTGEEVLEIQGHGGLIVLNMVLKRCLQLGCRLAQAGEFSQRAFLNHKLDLAQAESIADLISAQTEAAARSATRSLQGAFSNEINTLQEDLTQLRMLTEATLDFPEEDDVEWLEKANALTRLAHTETQLERVLTTAKQGALLRDGAHIVLIGQPNVGKSSLLNALAKEEVAIVTDIAGTTRDALRQTIVLKGLMLHIIDTAGLRDTDDPVEKIGIERTWKAIEQAQLALILIESNQGLSEKDREILSQLPEHLPRVVVINKIDKLNEEPTYTHLDTLEAIKVSAKTGAGIEMLENFLIKSIGWQGEAESLFIARERHLDAISRAKIELAAARDAYALATELFAEHLSAAQRALSEITGEFTPDDLLGEIFSRFCIGK